MYSSQLNQNHLHSPGEKKQILDLVKGSDGSKGTMSVKEACNKFGCSRQSLNKWSKKRTEINEHAEKNGTFLKKNLRATALDLNKCFKQIKLPICAPVSELQSKVSTMV